MESLYCWCEAQKERPHIYGPECAEWWWKNGEDVRAQWLSFGYKQHAELLVRGVPKNDPSRVELESLLCALSGITVQEPTEEQRARIAANVAALLNGG